MNRIWANRLEDPSNTRWTFADVPASRKEAVKAILAEDVAAGKITAEWYEFIIGEDYSS